MMIGGIYGESEICMATIIFYTCIMIPLRRMKETFLSFFSSSLALDEETNSSCVCVAASSSSCLLLPAGRYEEVRSGSVSVCSICLVEFEREDVVSQLPSCVHVFHLECIHQWLHRHNYTCPLCRSPFAFY